MVNIVKNIVPESKYNIKCPFPMTPTRIVVHNTANDATARNEIAYMTNNNYETSFHYAVDDKEIVQGIEENRNAWHASDGNGVGNREGIAIEICYSKSGGDRFIKAEQNAVELIVDILKRYGWGIDRVTKHQDYTNKYCPHRTLDMGWDRFLNMIKAKMNPITSIEPIERKSVRLKIDANLWDLTFTNPDNAISVKQFKTGDVIDNIVAIAHHPVGMNYYMTEYSYSNGIKNGFNVVDCEDIITEEPKEEPKEEPIITPIPTPTPEHKPEEPEITENFIRRLIKAIIDFINKLLNK